jgi:hydrogenase maturation protein HypF
MAREQDPHRRRFIVTGQVQGVGFRPFVYRLAREMGLSGWVLNDSRGVTIEVQGPGSSACRFAERLRLGLPALASIATCDEEEIAPLPRDGAFEIRRSEVGGATDAQVAVDTAVCEDCLREMNDPADPRYRYPFINCTNCGPRYTIASGIPYDRSRTTMADFAMCPLCAGEYRDPGSRRFHAQPVACPACGPRVWLADPRGRRTECPDAIAEAAKLLEAGRIVAIKGLGGFHLACRADDEAAVARLRRRKRRDAKPFALMVRDLAAARRLCQTTPQAQTLLSGRLRPIVLMPRRADAPAAVAASVAGGLDTLGVMLPYTPLHHLLFGHIDRPLVMTSANLADEPLVKDNDEAVERLGELADALLLHDRRIERRLDDSVVQLAGGGGLSVLRRARGFAPAPVRIGALPIANCQLPIADCPLPIADCPLPEATSPSSVPGQLAIGNRQWAILAVGAELKSAVCLLGGNVAVLGEHIGDLKDVCTYRHFIATVEHLEKLFEMSPDVIACDAHPLYLSTEYAVRRCKQRGARLVRVQHHHAHLAGTLAEHGRAGPAIGLVCDGVGYGTDAAVWGGEVLLADMRTFRRLGHLRYVRLPGGDKAAEETCRPAVAVLYDVFGEECLRHPVLAGPLPDLRNSGAGPAVGLPPGGVPGVEIAAASQPPRSTVQRQALADAVRLLRANANCPPSSSLGRWFDAIAFLCGRAAANRFEGEAPMLLEAGMARGVEDAYSFELAGGSPFTIDLRPMVREVCDDLLAGAGAGVVAAKFHNTVAAFLLAAARRAREQAGLSLVALSGGCFANRYLTARLTVALEAQGFEVLTHRTVPTNDGGIALGQAVVAAAQMGEW